MYYEKVTERICFVIVYIFVTDLSYLSKFMNNKGILKSLQELPLSRTNQEKPAGTIPGRLFCFPRKVPGGKAQEMV